MQHSSWFRMCTFNTIVPFVHLLLPMYSSSTDKLRYQNYSEPLGPVFTKEQQVTHVAWILGAVVGAFLADKDITFPWVISGVVMFLAGILALLFMKEEYFVRQSFSLKSGLQSMRNTIKASMHYGIRSKVVRFIVLMGTLQYFAIQAPNMQWQPFFSQFLPNKTSLGFVFGGISVSLIIGSALSPHFFKLMRGEKRALIVSQIGIGAGVLATVLFNWFPLVIGVFLLHEVAREGSSGRSRMRILTTTFRPKSELRSSPSSQCPIILEG